MSPSTTSRAERVKALFLLASELSRDEQAALLARECGEDSELACEVRELLAAHAADPPEPASASPEQRRPVTVGELRIPGYRLVELIGEGASAIVYEAVQERSGRAVAIKLLRAGILSKERRERFENEIATLRLLRHKDIAELIEPLTIDTGERSGPRSPHPPTPGFAMELVRGRDLITHAVENDLGDAARLALFVRIARAVQFAHSKQVVHRDLKPQNILVTPAGDPKILDFGVARTIQGDGGDGTPAATMHTSTGHIIGTVAYMSPEQAAGQAKDVDERADVYSLGVILFELLAGRLPYPIQNKSALDAMRIICQTPALSLGAVRPELRGDAAAVVGKALEKDPVRRYQSAGELADDAERLAANQRVSARPASTAYKLWSYVDRRRLVMFGVLTPIAALGVATIGGTVVTMLALAAGLGALVFAADRSLRIQAERVKLKAAAAALERQRWDIFEAGNLWLNTLDRRRLQHIGEDRSTPFSAARAIDEAILRPGLEALDRDHGLNVELSTSLRNAAGSAYRDLGIFDRAEDQLRRVLAARLATTKTHPGDIAVSKANLGYLGLCAGRYADAETWMVEAVSELRPISESLWRQELASCLTVLGRIRSKRDDWPGALAAHAEAVAVRSAEQGDEHVDYARARTDHARALLEVGSVAEAAAAARQAVAVLQAELPDRSLFLIKARLTLVRVLIRAGATDRGEIDGLLSAVDAVSGDLAVAGDAGRELQGELAELRVAATRAS